MSAPELLTVHEVAERLKITPRTVWRWCRSGDLPAPVRLGKFRRVVRWKSTEIESFLREMLSDRPVLSWDRHDL